MILETETELKYGYKSSDLGRTSTKMCILRCDYCKSIFERTMREISRGNKRVFLDACKQKECKNKKSKEVYNQSTINKIEQINTKRKETCIKKFGVDNAAKLKEKQIKAEETRLSRYGVRHALQSEKFQQKRNATMLDRYGTLSSLEASGKKEEIVEVLRRKAAETTERGRTTCLIRFGVDNAMKVKKVQKQVRTTNLKKYGVVSVVQTRANLDALAENSRLPFVDIKNLCANKNYVPLFEESDYKNKNQKLSFYCKKHDFKFESKISYIQTDFNQCPKCRNYNSSRFEEEIYEWLSQYDIKIERNCRNVIKGELDFYFPEHNLAIEFNGLYWHCELNKSKSYHQDKFEQCSKKSIDLLQICEDEWVEKPDIWKSMILNRLKLIKNKVGARELLICDLTLKEANDFFSKNHLQGTYNRTSCKCAVGLKSKDGEILFAALFNDFFGREKEKSLELSRMASKIELVISGAVSRILKPAKKFGRDKGYKKIISYSDCRYSSGRVYAYVGFDFIRESKASYDYTDWHKRYSRYSYRAKSGVSESDIVTELGLYKIYNAGNYRWEISLCD